MPDNPGVCRITAVTTHPPMGDKVRIWVAIPTSNWNGRFLGNGGGGFSGGSAAGVDPAGGAGYAAGATDTGHEGGSGSFALDANGRLNWQAIREQRARRHSRDDGHRQGAHAGDVRRGAALLVLQRVLDGRTAGAHGGAALSAGLQRHRVRRAGDQLEPVPYPASLGSGRDERGEQSRRRRASSRRQRRRRLPRATASMA